jgi:gliding motility-associated lipoprotein GldD
MKKHFLLLSLFCLMCISCRDYTPKPYAFFRIDEQPVHYVTYQDVRFSFKIPVEANVLKEIKSDALWLTIRFPHYHAYLYCTYFPLHQDGLRPALDDSYRMAFSHSVKANGIGQKTINLPEQKTGGILYCISGNVATPRQFFLTDSIANYFRASLYFDGTVNADSLMPVVKYLDANLDKMIHTFRWK